MANVNGQGCHDERLFHVYNLLPFVYQSQAPRLLWEFVYGRLDTRCAPPPHRGAHHAAWYVSVVAAGSLASILEPKCVTRSCTANNVVRLLQNNSANSIDHTTNVKLFHEHDVQFKSPLPRHARIFDNDHNEQHVTLVLVAQKQVWKLCQPSPGFDATKPSRIMSTFASFEWHPTKNLIAIADQSPKVALCTVDDDGAAEIQKCVYFERGRSTVHIMRWNHAGTQLLVQFDKVIHILTGTTLEISATFFSFWLREWSQPWSPSGHHIAIFNADRHLQVIDTFLKGSIKYNCRTPDNFTLGNNTGVVFHPKNEICAVHIIKTREGVAPRHLRGARHRQLWASDHKIGICLFDIAGHKNRRLDILDKFARSFGWNRSGDLFAVLYDERLVILDTTTLEQRFVYIARPDTKLSLFQWYTSWSKPGGAVAVVENYTIHFLSLTSPRMEMLTEKTPELLASPNKLLRKQCIGWNADTTILVVSVGTGETRAYIQRY